MQIYTELVIIFMTRISSKYNELRMSSQVIYTISTNAVDNFGLRAIPLFAGDLSFDPLAPTK
jgi:hypothetical protein